MSTSVRCLAGFLLIILLGHLKAAGAIVGEETLYFEPLPVSLEKDDTLSLKLPDYDHISIQARVSLPRFRPSAGLSKEAWSLGLAPCDDFAGATVTLRYQFDDFDSPSPETVIEIRSGGAIIDQLTTGAFGRDPRAYNTMVLEIDRSEGLMTLYGGTDPAEIATVKIDGFPDVAFVTATCRAELAMFVARAQVTPASKLMSGLDDTTLPGAIAATTSPVAGVWTYLDRTNSPDYARPGGKYTLAVVAAGDGFDIIYLGGAEVNASQWPRFTIKGHLTTSSITGTYSLTWYDAEFNELSEECFATLSPDGSILTIEFPLLNSTLRFERKGTPAI